MDPQVQEILDRATDIQQDYVVARLTYPNTAQAARSLGLSRSAPSHWENLEELEEAVHILRKDAIDAARLALQGLALEAVDTLKRAMGGKSTAAVNAANSILDRVGLPKQSQVTQDVNVSGGYPVVVFQNGQGDQDLNEPVDDQ